MKDKSKTKEQLIAELNQLRQQLRKSGSSKTYRKKTNQILKESEEKFRLIIETTNDMIFTVNLKGNFQFVNRAFKKNLGYSKSEIKKLNGFKLVHPEDLVRVRTQFAQLLDGKKVDNMEYKYRTKDGSYIHILNSASPLFDSRGNVVAALGVARNINQRKIMEEELRKARDELEKQVEKRAAELLKTNKKLSAEIKERMRTENESRESEKKYKSLIEQSLQAIVIVQDFHIVFANNAFAHISGYTVNELLALPPEKVKAMVHFEDQEFVWGRLRDRLKGKAATPHYEYRGIRKDGSTSWLEMYASRIHFNGKPAIQGVILDITERKKAEEALLASEAFNFALFQYNPIGIIVVDHAGRVIKSNLARRKSKGRIPKIGDVMYKDYAAKHEIDMYTELIECIRSGKIKRFPELKYGEKYITTSIAPFPMGAIITSQDITEQKQAEETLKESEEKFRILAERSPNMIFINKKGKIVYANKRCEEMTGYKRNEFYSSDFDFRCLIAPESLELVKSNFQKHLKGKQVKPYEYTIITKDGNRIEAINTSRLINYEGEKAILGIITDITGIIQAEKALRESEKRYRSVVENANDAIYIITPEGFQYVNPAFEKLTGFSSKEIYGNEFNFWNIIHPDDIKLIKEREEARKIGNDMSSRYEFRIIAKDGKTKIVEPATVDIGEKGKVKVMGILRDITERKQAEEQINASLKEKDVLLQEIHHRVKNNMQIIYSLLNLQSRNLEDKRASEVLKYSQNRVKSMALIHDRLYYSSDFAKIDFAEYVHDLTNHLLSSYAIDPNAVKLNINIKDILLDIKSAIPYGLIINELVTNSLKHAFPKDKKGEINIVMNPINKDVIELIVSDNGIGLPEDLNLNETKSMGLNLVTILAEGQLHGDIKLDRSKGTSFHLRLGVKQ